MRTLAPDLSGLLCNMGNMGKTPSQISGTCCMLNKRPQYSFFFFYYYFMKEVEIFNIKPFMLPPSIALLKLHSQIPQVLKNLLEISHLGPALWVYYFCSYKDVMHL